MSKIKTVYICSNCGNQSPRWEGKCTSCGEWNTYQEEIVSKPGTRESRPETWRDNPKQGNKPIPLPQIIAKGISRLLISDGELVRVLGGGIVPGSIVLIGGQPGIGKSTLMLQAAVRADIRVLYVSGEESEEQIKMRADRIGPPREECYILTETNTEKILKHAKDLQPDFVVIDSIQTLSSPFLESTPGSITQVRETAGEMQRFAKETGIPVFLIGHINKEGSIAGPKLLEHIVDTVLQFEGDRHYSYRILRTLKNRFGSTDEMGIYEMQADGLREVSNPSELLLAQKDEDLSGSAVGATMEGMRPMLIETQGLVSSAVYGNPQRTATGFDLRRMGMLLAVLEKRCQLPFAQNDVFLNIAGGIRVSDPAIDMAVVCALISSLHDIPVPHSYCFAGEIGLSGEIRAVTRAEQRIQEADRLGFSRIFISKYNAKGLDVSRYKIRISMVSRLEELLDEVFGL
ncbi:MAG: DNA repair protein RadA [Saprospiraceae bacterium]|nr:DNA repair protein RadA [Saprospiraceae bacterium]